MLIKKCRKRFKYKKVYIINLYMIKKYKKYILYIIFYGIIYQSWMKFDVKYIFNVDFIYF